MAWSGTVTELGRASEGSEVVFLTLGEALGCRQVVERKGTYHHGDRVIYAENGKFSDTHTVTSKMVGRHLSQGVLIKGRDVPRDDGVDMSTLVNFIEYPPYRLTREFMTQHKDEKLEVVVYPSGAKRFDILNSYHGEDPFLRRLRDRMGSPSRHWTRLWGWIVDGDRAILEGGLPAVGHTPIPREALVDFVLEFFEDLRIVCVIRPKGELPPAERSYEGLLRAVHKQLRLLRIPQPYHRTMKVTGDSEGVLEVEVYEPSAE